MVKKLLAFAMAIAIIASLGLIPTSASAFDEALILDVDFSTESYTDQTGIFGDPIEPGEGYQGTIEFVDDATVGKKVAHFQQHVLQYPVYNDGSMSEVFTIETYVKVKKQTFGMIAGSYFYNSYNGAGFIAGNFSGPLGNIGFSQGISGVVGFDSASHSIFGDKKQSYDQWVHLVLVHSSGKDFLYFNGVLVGEQESASEISHNEGQGFRIGGYNLAKQFAMEDMYMAFCRVYSEAATDAEVAALYTAATGSSIDSSNPTEVPSENPTEAPDNNATAAPTQAPAVDNTQTFDLGLVSLAAVALSSAVVIKRKRK